MTKENKNNISHGDRHSWFPIMLYLNFLKKYLDNNFTVFPRPYIDVCMCVWGGFLCVCVCNLQPLLTSKIRGQKPREIKITFLGESS